MQISLDPLLNEKSGRGTGISLRNSHAREREIEKHYQFEEYLKIISNPARGLSLTNLLLIRGSYVTDSKKYESMKVEKQRYL